MAQLPTIYTIQASDASQHTGRLQEILRNLKTENRIGDFTMLGPDDDLSSLSDMIKEGDLILIVLTRQIEAKIEQIENEVRTLKTRQHGLRIGEIIVDHVVYDNEFLTFPADLRPIRNSEDMDAAWGGIEQSLKDMFPAKERQEPVPVPINWPKYLKIAGILIGVILVFFIIIGLFDGDNGGQVVADFNINPTECEKAPCAIEFSNTSENADTYRWDFGDGITSSEANPSHNYEKAGTYTVRLIASKNGQSDEKAERIEVTEFKVTNVVVAVSETANFSGNCPHKFNFIARITVNKPGHIRYTWLRRDGATAPEQTLEFTESGTKTVQTSWTLGGSGRTYSDYWQQLKIVDPNEMVSNRAVFNLTCKREITEDCLSFNYNNLRVGRVRDHRVDPPRTYYNISDGTSRMMTFRTQEKAQLARNIIRHYKMNSHCFAVRPNPGLKYFKVGNSLPSGNYPDEDCIRINNPDNLTIRRNSSTSYSILDGNHIPFSAKSLIEAKKIVELVKYYKPRYTCFVERPDPGMVYLKQ